VKTPEKRKLVTHLKGGRRVNEKERKKRRMPDGKAGLACLCEWFAQGRKEIVALGEKGGFHFGGGRKKHKRGLPIAEEEVLAFREKGKWSPLMERK